MRQDGKFGEVENSIGLPDEDNDCVAVFFAQALPPARCPFPAKQGRAQGGMDGGLRRGKQRALRLPQAKSGRQSHHQQGKETMHHHRGLCALGKAQEVPGMLALFEDPILNHTAPVVGIKDRERVVDRSIGQIDRASAFGHPIVPAAHHHRIDRLALIVASMRVLGLSGCSIPRVAQRGSSKVATACWPGSLSK